MKTVSTTSALAALFYLTALVAADASAPVTSETMMSMPADMDTSIVPSGSATDTTTAAAATTIGGNATASCVGHTHTHSGHTRSMTGCPMSSPTAGSNSSASLSLPTPSTPLGSPTAAASPSASAKPSSSANDSKKGFASVVFGLAVAAAIASLL